MTITSHTLSFLVVICVDALILIVLSTMFLCNKKWSKTDDMIVGGQAEHMGKRESFKQPHDDQIEQRR